MRNKILPKLQELADLCLDKADISKEYSDKDLVNASLIFMEVFCNKAYDYQRTKLTQPQMGVIAEETGKSLRQLIKLATGIDMHEAVLK